MIDEKTKQQPQTPIFDTITAIEGIKLADAAVFGVVWRFCQMEKGLCEASAETMGDKLGVSHRTIRRSLDILEEKGLVINTTPDARNTPHKYILTGLAKELTARLLVEQNVQPNGGLPRQIVQPETNLPRQFVQPKDENTDLPGQFVIPRLDNLSNETTLLNDNNTSSDSFQESEVITAHEILRDPKRFTIKQIALVKFTRSQYLQLIEKEKSLGNPRKGLLRHVNDTLTTKPPAVEVYRSVAYTYPERSLWPDIGKTVGENQADLERWRDVIKNYIGLGWNKTNVVNMLDYFNRREIPTMNGNKNGKGDRPTTAKISDNGGAYI